MVAPAAHSRIVTYMLNVTIYAVATTVNFINEGPNQPASVEPLQAGGATGQTEIIDIGGFGITEIMVPAGFTGTVLSFLTQKPGSSAWQSLRKPDGSEYTVTIAAGLNTMIPQFDFSPIDKLKIRSGTNAAPVTQAADAVLTLRLYIADN